MLFLHIPCYQWAKQKKIRLNFFFKNSVFSDIGKCLNQSKVARKTQLHISFSKSLFLQVRAMLLYNQACKFFHIKTPLFLQRLILSFCLLFLYFHLLLGCFSERHNSAYSVLETSIFQISTRNSIFFCWFNRFSTKLSEAKLPPKGLWRSFAMLA